MRKDQIDQLLEELGQALSAGDLHKVSNYWEVPAWCFPMKAPSPSPMPTRSRNSSYKPTRGIGRVALRQQGQKSSVLIC